MTKDGIIEESYWVPLICTVKNVLDDPAATAIHEVRHRIQDNYPEIRLLTMQDVPTECFDPKPKVDSRSIETLTPKETDAYIVEALALYQFIKTGKRNLQSFLPILLLGVEQRK